MPDNSSTKPTDKNHKWIYTYDYAPDSVWEPWRTSEDELSWIEQEASEVAKRALNSFADVCNDAYKGCGRSHILTFALLADSHYAYNGTWQDTVSALSRLQEKIPFDGVIHLGDLSDGLLPLEKTKEIEAGCIKDLKKIGASVHIVPGNHDYNYFRGNLQICYPDNPRYYKDFPQDSLRLIFIDSFDPKESLRYGFSQECIRWLDDTLSQMPAGYRAIIFSHVTPLVQLQAWAKEIRGSDMLMEVLNVHAGDILAFINGHNHCDHIFNYSENGGFPIISINCAKCEYFLDHKPDGAVVPTRRLGDRTQESFDIMRIDAQEGRISFTRFGAGYDRLVDKCKGRYVSCGSFSRVITYGIRFKDFAIQKELFAFKNNGDIEIVGEIGFAPEDEEIFYCRKSPEEAFCLDYDYIVVQEKDRSALYELLLKADRADLFSKVIDISCMVLPHHDIVKRRQLEILTELTRASDEQVSDREWMKKRVYDYGINPFFKLAKNPEAGVTYTTCGILQVPAEFLDLCMYISDAKWKGAIKNAIEIGVWRGSSSYILAALLYRNNPDMTYHMVDIYDGLLQFDEVKEIVPSLEKCIPKRSEDFAGEAFDFCFIDADHSYDGMMNDYRNVGRYTSKILVFHDIFGHEYDHLNGGTVRGWQEIKELEKDKNKLEFSKYPDFWMGLGVVEK